MTRFSGLILTAAATLAACSVEPTQKPFTLSPGTGLTTDASLRVVTASTPGAGTQHGRVAPGTLVCTEPSPDVASALVNSLGLAVKADAAKGPFTAGAGVAASFSSAQQVAQLAERTVAIQVLRETLWRACEAFNNGGISEINYSLLLARIPETIATLRYGELAGGDFGRAGASIGTAGEATASASGSAEAKRLQEAALEATSKMEESFRKTRDAEQQLERSLSEKSDAEKRLTAKQQEVAKTRSDLTAASPQTAPALERELTELRKEERQLNEKVQEKTAEVAERQRKAEQSKSEQSKRTDEAKTSQTLASAAKTSGTAQGAGGLTRTVTRETAQVLGDMHRDFLRDDFSSDSLLTSCAIGMSSPDLYPVLAKECLIGGSFHLYTTTVMQQQASYLRQRSMNFHLEALEKTKASVEIAKAKASARLVEAQACRDLVAAAKTDEQKTKIIDGCLKRLASDD